MIIFSPITAAQIGRSHQIVDQDYILALSTANRFLCAWQLRRQDEARSVLTRELINRYSSDELSSILSGLSNPHHQSFEVGSGRRLSGRRYAFEVILYEHYTGTKYHRERSKPSRIVLIKVGPEKWLVDRLPIP
jgi:hypothetical protein